MPKSSKKVLLVSHDVVGQKMAGPGIRYFRLAEELSKHFDVTLAAPNQTDLKDLPFKLVQYESAESFPPLIDVNDFVFAQLLEPSNIVYATKQHKALIYDLYNLIPIEYLGSLKTTEFDPATADRTFQQLIEDYQIFMRSGRYFVCSNERQADFLLGMMTASQSILPSTTSTKTFEQLIGLVPFGMSSQPPKKTNRVMKGVIPGIDKDDFVIVWAGGIWDWFDPLSLIRAMGRLKSRTDIKLVFMGVQHPNKEVGKMKMVGRAQTLAKELGLEKKSVFFLPGWLKFEDRANYLLEADAAASIHYDSIETRYSFRTRILDHFWAGLPSIVTTGDWFAELIGRKNLGAVVGYQDDAGIAEAISQLKDDPKQAERIRQNIASVARDFTWKRTSQDLVRFISEYEPSQADTKDVLSQIEPQQRLRNENEQLATELAQQRERAQHFQTRSENFEHHLTGITNSRRWKLITSLSKIYRLGRRR